MCVISDARGIGLLLPDTAGVSVTKDTVTHSSWLVAESMFLTATRQPSFHRNRGTSFSLLDTVFPQTLPKLWICIYMCIIYLFSRSYPQLTLYVGCTVADPDGFLRFRGTPFLSFCVHASPASCVRTCAVKMFWTHPFKILDPPLLLGHELRRYVGLFAFAARTVTVSGVLMY